MRSGTSPARGDVGKDPGSARTHGFLWLKGRPEARLGFPGNPGAAFGPGIEPGEVTGFRTRLRTPADLSGRSNPAHRDLGDQDRPCPMKQVERTAPDGWPPPRLTHRRRSQPLARDPEGGAERPPRSPGTASLPRGKGREPTLSGGRPVRTAYGIGPPQPPAGSPLARVSDKRVRLASFGGPRLSAGQMSGRGLRPLHPP